MAIYHFCAGAPRQSANNARVVELADSLPGASVRGRGSDLPPMFTVL